jgi:hypothetical protein
MPSQEKLVGCSKHSPTPVLFPYLFLLCSLVRVPKAIARIPTLAIHLSVGDERTTFKPNLQNHFPPLLATKVPLPFSSIFTSVQ